ncbi:hypothetical protein IPJ72_00005 [Candidatus Peregrinibacteria bacterium]|nr:MAG: hypothetical protein IPJ72_00005 [Candidatus Peregrinibacteria bacterium]
MFGLLNKPVLFGSSAKNRHYRKSGDQPVYIRVNQRDARKPVGGGAQMFTDGPEGILAVANLFGVRGETALPKISGSSDVPFSYGDPHFKIYSNP